MEQKAFRPIEIKKVSKATVELESSRSDKICKFLNTIPRCKATKRHQGGYGRKGDPDITGCLRGLHFELEVKQPGKNLTQIQKVKLAEWKEVGSITGRVENVNDVLDVFKAHKVPLYE